MNPEIESLRGRIEDLAQRVRSALVKSNPASDEHFMREYSTYLNRTRRLFPDNTELWNLPRLPEDDPSLAITIFRDPLAALRATDSAISRLLTILSAPPFDAISSASQDTSSGTTYDVFLSHSASDDQFCSLIANYLRDSDISVFHTPESISSGKWEPAIEDALRNSQHLWLLLTPNALTASTWVHQEFGYFFGYHSAHDKNAERRLHYIELSGNSVRPGMYAHFQGTPVSSFDDPVLVARIISSTIGKPFTEPANSALTTTFVAGMKPALEIVYGISGSYEQRVQTFTGSYHLFRVYLVNNLSNRTIDDVRIVLNKIEPEVITFLSVPLLRMHAEKVSRQQAIATSYSVHPMEGFYFDVVAKVESEGSAEDIELRFMAEDLPNGLPSGRYTFELMASGRDVPAFVRRFIVDVSENGQLIFMPE